MQSTKRTGTYNYHIVSHASANLQHRRHARPTSHLLDADFSASATKQICGVLTVNQTGGLQQKGCHLRFSLKEYRGSAWVAVQQHFSDSWLCGRLFLRSNGEGRVGMPPGFNPGHEGILWRKIPKLAVKAVKEMWSNIPLNYNELLWNGDNGLVWHFFLPLCFASLFARSVSEGSWPMVTHTCVCVCVWPCLIDSPFKC